MKTNEITSPQLDYLCFCWCLLVLRNQAFLLFITSFFAFVCLLGRRDRLISPNCFPLSSLLLSKNFLWLLFLCTFISLNFKTMFFFFVPFVKFYFGYVFCAFSFEKVYISFLFLYTDKICMLDSQALSETNLFIQN